MLSSLRLPSRQYNVTLLIVAAVLALAFLLGLRASVFWLAVLFAGFGGLILLRRPVLGLVALIVAALAVPVTISTGTEVSLNAVTLLLPGVAAIWLLDQVIRGRFGIISSSVNRPLMLFLLASLVSLLIGRAIWDPLIPLNNNFLLVQLAQWGIFVLSALAFWLMANLAADEKTLWRIVAFFLFFAGGTAIVQAVPGLAAVTAPITTFAFARAPLWILLAALAGGQLLWNNKLALGWKVFLIAILLATLIYALVAQQEAVSNWVGLAVVLVTLFWLRFPRARWFALLAVVALIIMGLVFPAIYQFAGGDAEWTESGGSRLVLIQRVIEVTLRNPITGLGPAAYRPYANATPLLYQRIYWLNPLVNSHNNYVDLFAHGGLLGLTLFVWFVWEIAQLGARLRRRFTVGFAVAYVNGMLAAGVGALVLMAFADWILPFVYNIGFIGFQASVLVWLFMGGLVALDNMPQSVNDDKNG